MVSHLVLLWKHLAAIAAAAAATAAVSGTRYRVAERDEERLRAES